MGSTKAVGQNARAQARALPGEPLRSKNDSPTSPTRRALVISSDSAVLRLCREVLSGTRYLLDQADSIDAIGTWQSGQADLLFIDCSLAETDALELLQRIKAMCPFAVPVILADDVTVDGVLAALRGGAVDCVTKPLGREPFREAVVRAMEIDRRNREYALLKALSPLFEVSNALNSSLDLDELLSSIARHAALLANAHASHVALLDSSTQHLVFRAGHGHRERWERGHRRIVDGPALEAILTGRCISIPDLHTGTSSECLACAEGYGLSSSVWVPLSVGNRCIGVIAVCSKARSHPSPEETDVLRALASYAATAVERARLYQETKRALDKLDILYSINRAVGSSFEMDEVIDAIFQIEAVLPYDSASVFVLDERDDVVRMHASRNLDAELQAITSFKVGEGIVGWVAAHAESLNVPNTALDDRYEPRGVVDNPRSILAVPLRAGGKVLAVLNLTRYRVSAFTDQEARLAELVATQAAQALRHAQLYQNACYLLEEESALYSLAKIITGSGSAEELLSKAAPLVNETLRAESCIVCLMNPATNRLFLARSVGIPDEYAEHIAETVDTWRLHREALSSGEPVAQVVRKETYIPDAPAPGESLMLGAWNGLVSVLSTPLTIHQRVLGVITVARRAISGVFLHRDKDLLANMASQLSVAIEELRLRTRDMLTLYELSQFSGATFDLEEIYRKILNKVGSLFDCEGICLLISNEAEKKLELKCALGSAKSRWRQLEQLSLDYLAERVSTAYQLPLFALAENASAPSTGESDSRERAIPELIHWPTTDGSGSVLVAPMVVEGSVIGALAISFPEDLPPSEDRRMLLTSLAVEAALVIRNTSLYAASQQLAIREERNRIAREFHDGVAQNLAHLMHKMQLISRLLDADMARAKTELERSRLTLEESVKELRRCIYALGPVHLEGKGISQALERIATEFAEQNELQATLELDPVSNLHSRVEAAVFRIVQEALNNIRKHAQASRFGIVLTMSEDYLHLVIEDDGKGFDCDTVPVDSSAHFGVPQMKERARELGGYLEIRSSPGAGTTIELWVPVGGRGKLEPTG